MASPRYFSRWLAYLAALSCAISASAGPLRVGVTLGVYADSMNAAAQEANKQGLDVEWIEFSDRITPNVALAAGDLDLAQGYPNFIVASE